MSLVGEPKVHAPRLAARRSGCFKLNKGFCKGLYTAVISLVAEWIHFTLLGRILPTIKPKVCTFWGL